MMTGLLARIFPAKKSAPAGDIVRVDRTIRPTYPNWVDPDWINAPDFVALERTGPDTFELGAVARALWLHEGQKNGGRVRGQKIYDSLVRDNTLPQHLALADLLAIQKEGIAAFRKHFAGKVIYGWRGTVRSRDGNFDVPCLYESGDGVVLDWNWLANDWSDYAPAARYS